MVKKIWNFLLFFLTFGIAIASMRYWSFEKTDLLFTKSDELFNSIYYKFSFYGHVIFGPLALMIGPFQFMPKFRNKNLRLHRSLGKIYILSCLISGVAGLSSAQNATGGNWNTLGFSLLAIAWLITTSQAWMVIKKGNVVAHQIWMLRSYALTLSAVTLRIQLGIFQGFFEMIFLESYSIVPWSCWIPNLLIIEWWIRNKLDRKTEITL